MYLPSTSYQSTVHVPDLEQNSESFTDDDGETNQVVSDEDLTEAIQYFQSGNEDRPLSVASSAFSIFSGRGERERKVVLPLTVKLDYDGPSLSDTSSLASSDEYRAREVAEQRRSMDQYRNSFDGRNYDLDDDSVTVSSRDPGLRPATSSLGSPRIPRQQSSVNRTPRPPHALRNSFSLSDHSEDVVDPNRLATSQYDDLQVRDLPRGVFEQLRLSEATSDISSEDALPSDTSAANGLHGAKIGNRHADWLREQTSMAINSALAGPPAPSVSDSSSSNDPQEYQNNGLATRNSFDSAAFSEDLNGALALERGNSGQFYYTYTSSQSQGSVAGDIPPQRPLLHSESSEPLLSRTLHSSQQADMIHPDTPAEVLQYLPNARPTLVTDCSSCGTILDSFRYVCSTCGEKEPHPWPDSSVSSTAGSHSEIKGQGLSPSTTLFDPLSLPHASSSSLTLTNAYDLHKPLPNAPHSAPAQSKLRDNHSRSTGSSSTGSYREDGYELCYECIGSAWLDHDLATNAALLPSPSTSGSPGSTDHELSSPSAAPPSPEEEQRMRSQGRRTAPRRKGHMRHAYLEKFWDQEGWQDVEQDADRHKCSICDSFAIGKRYKCSVCSNFFLCKFCYSQVHEIHPTHAFLLVPDKPQRTRSEPALDYNFRADSLGEDSMVHPNVQCTHCMRDIVGARFHCVICQNVDVCSNCESVGLPGNIGGHDMSHIMIKIPYPLTNNEVENVSRAALSRWTAQDDPNLPNEPPTRRARANSVDSSFARTVVGLRNTRGVNTAGLEHGVGCDACHRNIQGVRYQCATCVSLPRPFNLCSTCEHDSYNLHDPFHVFFKLPRPVDKEISASFSLVPPVYKTAPGPRYIRHPALCDRCMKIIEGVWYRCAYCAKDMCEDCEELGVHDPMHVFVVFKSDVDMRLLRSFADVEDPTRCPPLIPYPVYRL